ncbi:MAG TPA: zf-HC2 domain-containing protein [Longimicrobium sp.]
MHLSEDDLHDYAGGELSPERMAGAAAHLDACAACRAAAEPLIALTARLAALPRAADTAGDLWPALQARLAADERPAHVAVTKVISLDERRKRRMVPAWAAHAAAAAVVFTLGFGGGRLSGTGDAAVMLAAADSVATAMEAAVRVQRAGTEYVAAVAQFVAFSRGRDSLSVAQGREATIAACYGASRELTRLRGDDTSAVNLFRTAATTRHGALQPDTPSASVMF